MGLSHSRAHTLWGGHHEGQEPHTGPIRLWGGHDEGQEPHNTVGLTI